MEPIIESSCMADALAMAGNLEIEETTFFLYMEERRDL